jgi:hypothetical protein
MNGTNAQFVSLTCSGNGYLRGLTPNQFFPANSTCQFCDRVNFVEFSKPLLGKPKEIEVANTPDEWFEYLKRASVRGLRLASTPRDDPNISDRMSAGFVGGGEAWNIEAVYANGRSSYWRSRWEVWNQNAPERRIWRVTYGRVGESKTSASKTDGLTAIRNELQAALKDIHEFSSSKECRGFTDCFARALAVLDGTPAAQRGYHKDLASAGVVSSEAVRILDACQHAWVFGGMGSWNDMSFYGEDGKIYDRVSERLFHALNQAIPIAANDSYYAG